MSWNFFKIMHAAALGLGLMLSGCGGGGSSAPAPVPATKTFSLSGVVVSGTVSGGVAVGAIQAQANVVNGALANAIVIAVDSLGNTQTTSADKQGVFTLDLQEGAAYAVVFLDAKTMKVIGSLVQASNTKAAGAVTMTGNANLGTVVVNPATGLAISDNDANGTLTGSTVGASTLDSNGDGKVTQGEITAKQTATLSTGSSALTSLSFADFFTKPNMWISQMSSSTDTWGTWAEYTLSVSDQLQMKGPQGTLVNAVKDSSVVYWHSSTDVYSTTAGYPALNGGGVYSYTSATFQPFPALFDQWSGPWVWGYANYVDATNNVLWSTGDFVSSAPVWTKDLPLNFKLGETVKTSGSDSFGTFDQSIVITLATENGSNYLFTDAAIPSQEHVVIKADVNWTWTPNTTCTTCGSGNSGSASLYIVGGYGAVVDVKDPITGVIRNPSVALKDTTFGMITSDVAGNFVAATNLNPLTTTTPKLSNAQRDQALAYVWNARDKVGAYDYFAAVPTDYVYVTRDQYGSAASPASWDPATYTPLVLTAGNIQPFTSNIDYALAANGTAHYEMRVFNPATSTSTTLVGTASVAQVVNALNTTAQITGSVTLPSIAAIKAINPSSVITYTDYTGASVTEGLVELWLVVKNATNGIVTEEVLDWYTIR